MVVMEELQHSTVQHVELQVAKVVSASKFFRIPPRHKRMVVQEVQGIVLLSVVELRAELWVLLQQLVLALLVRTALMVHSTRSPM
jgi:hypothetical protein